APDDLVDVEAATFQVGGSCAHVQVSFRGPSQSPARQLPSHTTSVSFMAFPSVPERSPTRRRPDSACCYEIWRCSRHFRGSFAADVAGLPGSVVVGGANELSVQIRHGLAWVPRSLGRPLPAGRYVMLELHVCTATSCRWNAGWKNRPPRCGGRWPTRPAAGSRTCCGSGR